MASIPDQDIERAHRALRDCIEQARRLNARAKRLLRDYRQGQPNRKAGAGRVAAEKR